MGCKKVPKSDFQTQFFMSKIIQIFLIFFFFFHWKYQFRRRFLKTSIFEPLCFLKWCPIFDSPGEHLWKSNQIIIFHFTDYLLPLDSNPQNSTTDVTLRKLFRLWSFSLWRLKEVIEFWDLSTKKKYLHNRIFTYLIVLQTWDPR